MRVGTPITVQPPTDGLRIDCDECSQQGTATCDDCIVTCLCDHTAGSAVVVDVDEARALLRLGNAGLAPRLRHRRRTG